MVRSLFVPSVVADAVRSPSDREHCSIFCVGASEAYGVVGSSISAAVPLSTAGVSGCRSVAAP